MGQNTSKKGAVIVSRQDLQSWWIHCWRCKSNVRPSEMSYEYRVLQHTAMNGFERSWERQTAAHRGPLDMSGYMNIGNTRLVFRKTSEFPEPSHASGSYLILLTNLFSFTPNPGRLSSSSPPHCYTSKLLLEASQVNRLIFTTAARLSHWAPTINHSYSVWLSFLKSSSKQSLSS